LLEEVDIIPKVSSLKATAKLGSIEKEEKRLLIKSKYTFVKF